MSTDWHIAGFADVGNIWYGPRSLADRGRFTAESVLQGLAAVGAGFGIRMDWEYLIFRIDVAYKAYDPSVSRWHSDRGWFESPDPYIHFGIGHSF
jgi:outer membrane protein insertion porin family